MKRLLICSMVAMLAFAVSCSKTKTVLQDVTLIENPADKKVTYITNGKIKRGEYVIVKEEKDFSGKKYVLVQIEGVSTKGWVEDKLLKEGKIESVTIINDADIYARPNKKSDITGKVRAGQIAFKLEEKDGFILVQYPGKEGYILKESVGTMEMIKKSISISGIGKATVAASSQFVYGEGREMEFDPRNLFDGSLQTAWSEGKRGDTGIGEYVTISFEQPIVLKSVGIVNGWTKSEELYKVNGRVAQLKVVSDNGNEISLDLNDNVLDYQNSEVNLVGTSFKFIITKVYEGKDSDTCMSEIKLQGEPAPQGGGM
jgi:Nicotine adenine dinucleotide glycohydrolase (NADase)